MADQTLPEQIATQLRRDILRGKLAAGSAIKERDNATEMGVSRTPMREAIRILAKEGLVILRPSRSPLVAQPVFKEIADQVAVMLALEHLSVELACERATPEEIAALWAINDRMADLYYSADTLDLFEIDMSFHTAIAQASHNPALAETHRAYLARLWRARYLSASQRRNRERVIRQHSDILKALETRDPAAARAAVDRHLGHLAEDIRPVIEQETQSEEIAGDDE